VTNDERTLLLALAKGVVKLLEDEAEAWDETNAFTVEIFRLIERVQAASSE